MAKKRIDHNGKKVYIGIDVHKRTLSITAIGDHMLPEKVSMEADYEKFVGFLHKTFVGAEIFTVYEAGFSGFHLHRTLEKAGIKNIVVNPASIEVASRDRVKTDLRDSAKMAEQLKAARLVSIRIPPEEQERARLLSRTRSQLVEHRTAVSLQIRAKFLQFGLLTPTDNRQMSLKMIGEIEALYLPEELRDVLVALKTIYLTLSQQILALEKKLELQAAKDASAEKIYRSVPGIGPVSARILSNELGDMSQFPNEGALFNFLGLTPTEHSSGTNKFGESVQRRGHISRQGSPRIRAILTEVAHRAILKDEALLEFHRKLSVRCGGKKSIVAVSRKLIGRIRACFKNKKIYALRTGMEK